MKRILRYLKGTDDLCLWYPRGGNFDLVGYTDADFTGNKVDKKSTSGMAQFLGPCLVSWVFKDFFLFSDAFLGRNDSSTPDLDRDIHRNVAG